MKKTFTYYITYSLVTTTGRNGFGSCEITRTKPISSAEEVLSIAKTLADEDPTLESVLILSWIPLRKKIALFK